MLIDYVSDLHLDFWYNPNKSPDNFIKSVLKPKGGDVLILAGDQGHYNWQVKAFLLEMLKLYADIILVTGNHDMYLIGAERKRFEHKSLARVKDMQKFCDTVQGLHYLDGTRVEIQGVMFGGVGYWYDAPVWQWRAVMNDSRLITMAAPFKVPGPYGDGYIEGGFDTKKYYEGEKAKLIPLDCHVLVTHVNPSKLDLAQMPREYHGDPDNVFYENDDLALIKAGVVIFGHTHNFYDYELSYKRFLCNPVGYKGENSGKLLGIKQFEYIRGSTC